MGAGKEQDDAAQRLQLLLEVEYPLSAIIVGAAPMARIHPEQLSSPLDHLQEKEMFDATLAQWVGGQLTTLEATQKLFPFAVHFCYADAPLEEINQLPDRQRDLLPLAQHIMNAWFAIQERLPPKDRDRYFDQLLDVEIQNTLGFSPDAFKEYIRQNDRGEGPQR